MIDVNEIALFYENISMRQSSFLTFQEAAQEVDLRRGPGGEIGEGAFVDLGADADGLAEEDGGGRVAVGDGLDVHGSIIQH